MGARCRLGAGERCFSSLRQRDGRGRYFPQSLPRGMAQAVVAVFAVFDRADIHRSHPVRLAHDGTAERVDTGGILRSIGVKSCNSMF